MNELAGGSPAGALLAGIVAGLGVAIPLGPIGILILETGISRGLARAAAAALGTASVDLAYSLVAVFAGSLVAGAIAPVATPIRLVSAAVLAAIAARGLLRLRRSAADAPGAARASAATPAATPASWGPFPTFLRFVGLTAINPLTILYFSALAVGLPALGASPGSRGAFAVGVGLGSGAWQLALASLGAVLHHRLPGRARLVTGIVGDVIVLALAVAVAASALPDLLGS